MALESECLSQYLWIVIVGILAAFFMAYGIGANDVANAFATSVGSKALKLWQAIVIAAVMEFSGAVLLGNSVTSTVRNSIVDLDAFVNRPDELIFGMMCALIGGGTWLIIATRLGLPVSTTHTIIGSIIGFGIAFSGFGAVAWGSVGMIVLSWFLSPLLSGIIAALLFFGVRTFILRSPNSLQRGYIFYPLLVALTLAVNAFFIMYKGLPKYDIEDYLPYWAGALVCIGFGLIVGALIHFFVIPIIKKRVAAMTEQRALEKNMASTSSATNAESKDEMAMTEKSGAEDAETKNEAGDIAVKIESDSKDSVTEVNFSKQTYFQKTKARLLEHGVQDEAFEDAGVVGMHDNAEVFDENTEHLFVYLQVFTATLDSFAHGANDVANSIAPLAAIVSVYTTCAVASKSSVPIWILALGGAGIVAGLATYGYMIIKKIGVSLTKITPSRGFTIELGAAFVVVTASLIGVPVSTTHCQVGATVAVGLLEGKTGINWKLFGTTFFGWVFTLVFAALVTGLLFSFGSYSPSNWYFDSAMLE